MKTKQQIQFILTTMLCQHSEDWGEPNPEKKLSVKYFHLP